MNTNATGCTCGACDKRGHDDHGNVDYGQRWSAERSTYITRNCPVARERAGMSHSDARALEAAARL